MRRVSEAARSSEGGLMRSQAARSSACTQRAQSLRAKIPKRTQKSSGMKCGEVAENKKENENLGSLKATQTLHCQASARILNCSHRIFNPTHQIPNLSLVQNPQKLWLVLTSAISRSPVLRVTKTAVVDGQSSERSLIPATVTFTS